MAYNAGEVVIAFWLAFADDSVALRVFALDSAIQFHAAAAFYRLDTSRVPMSAAQEVFTARGTRMLVSVGFGGLAGYTVVHAVGRLWSGHPAIESSGGVTLAGASLVVMGLMAWLTLRVATARREPVLARMGWRFVAAAHLPLILAVGLGAGTWAGWTWADPLTALLLTPWIVKEGIDAGRGRDL